MVRVLLYIPGLTRRWAAVDFLLDTGASTSCVHPRDATARLGIDAITLRTPSAWARQHQSQGVGGSATDFIVTAHYALRRDDGGWDTYQDDLAIARSTLANQTLPSLLGWDILQHYRIVADWHAGSVRLEPP
jgi:hypothetical protein